MNFIQVDHFDGKKNWGYEMEKYTFVLFIGKNVVKDFVYNRKKVFVSCFSYFFRIMNILN
jgi:hypothetical protein